jgi:hypothetical protein
MGVLMMLVMLGFTYLSNFLFKTEAAD